MATNCDAIVALSNLDLAAASAADADVMPCLNQCSVDNPEGQFSCASGDETVPESWVCDGEPDCADGSDEADCT